MGCACNTGNSGENSSLNEIKLLTASSPSNKENFKNEKIIKSKKFANNDSTNISNYESNIASNLNIKSNEGYINISKISYDKKSNHNQSNSDLDYEDADNINFNFKSNINNKDGKIDNFDLDNKSEKSKYSDTNEYNRECNYSDNKNMNLPLEFDVEENYKVNLFRKINLFREDSSKFHEKIENIKKLIILEENSYFIKINNSLIRLNNGPDAFTLKHKNLSGKRQLIYDQNFEITFSLENSNKIISGIKENEKVCKFLIERIFKDQYLKLLKLGYSLNGFYYDICVASSDLSVILQVVDDNIFFNQRFKILSSDENKRIGISTLFYNNAYSSELYSISFYCYGCNYYEDED